MDTKWFRFLIRIMVWLLPSQYIKAMVNTSTMTIFSTVTTRVFISRSPRATRINQLVTHSSNFYGTISSPESFTITATQHTISSSSASFCTPTTEFSTQQVSSSALGTKLQPYHKSSPTIRSPHFNAATASASRHSTISYVPTENDKKSRTNRIPLIILAPSAAGGGVLLILIFILCCWNHRRLKRKKIERIFRKYYRPTLLENSLPDLEDKNDISKTWGSQLKLSSENKQENITSESPEGISNKAFASETLPEMNLIKEKLSSDLPVETQNDTECSTSNKEEEGLPTPHSANFLQAQVLKTTENDVALSEKDNSQCDDHEASLLVLQNLDNVLNNECACDEARFEEETLTNIDEKNEGEHFVVVYPFLMSNTDEISLDVGTIVSVIECEPSGWSLVANQNGDTGWFPSQYLVHFDTDKAQDDSEDVHTNHQTGYSIPDLKRLYFYVLQSFSGSSPEELSLSKHDIVSVIENSSSGWSWVNEPNAGTGWFPTNYLEPLVFPKKKDTTLGTHQSSTENPDYLHVIKEEIQYVYASPEEIQKVKKEGRYKEYEAKAYRASHAFKASNEDELTFKENETILVLQETDTGWWRGSTYLGEGWFPATFVEDPITCQDMTAVNVDQPCINTGNSVESYETVDADYRQDCYHVSDCNEFSRGPSPYEVTELVPMKSQPVLERDREKIHQVPQGISQHATKKRIKARGKASPLKPRRPPPPPPTAPQPCAVPPLPASQSVSFPPAHSSSTPVTPLPTALSAQTLQTAPLSEDVQTTSPPADLQTIPLFQSLPAARLHKTPPAKDENRNKLGNEDSNEPVKIEGVVIFRPKYQSESSLSKLFKVTKRRSIINPNPLERPPNRPVPIPFPRKARNPPKSTDNYPRPRPIKMPRNSDNDKTHDILSTNNVPKLVPKRPPPPMPGNLDKFRRKRLSSSSSDDTSGINNNVNVNDLSKFDSAVTGSNNNHNDDNNKTCNEKTEERDIMDYSPKPRQRNRKPSNGQEDQFREKSEQMASPEPTRVSPKPKPRKRSQEQIHAIQMPEPETNNRNSAIQNQNMTEDLTKHKNDGRIGLRSPYLSEELSNNQSNEAKPRPKIKPRSKSLENIFSSNACREDNGEKHEKETISESQPRRRLHSLQEDSSSGESNQNEISDSHDHVQYDNNQNISEVKSPKSLHPPSRGPARPKPKARTKQNGL